MQTRRVGKLWSRTPDLSSLEWIVCLTPFLLVPGLFTRSVFSVFSVPKVTVLWLVALVLLALELGRSVSSGHIRLARRPVDMTVGFLVVAVVTAALFSPHRHMAWSGVGVRWSGALTYVAYGVILRSFAVAATKDRLPMLTTVVAVGAVPVFGYALVQVLGLDPLDWPVSLSFGGDVMSTFGNPNFSSAYLAIATPFMLVLALRRRGPRIVRVAGAAAFALALGSIGFLMSLQGQLAALSSLVVVLAVVSDGRRVTGRLVLRVAPYVLAVPLVPLVGTLMGPEVLLGVAVLYAIWASFPEPSSPEAEADGRDASPRRSPLPPFALVLGGGLAAGVSALIVVSLFGPRLSGALGERWEFWRVAMDMFADRPLTGLGLETFGTRFAELRSIEHAEVSPSHLSDSAHSVPFGLLARGGLLVALAYTVLVIVTGWSAVSAWRRTRGDERLLVAGVIGGWVAFHLQSAVSVDIPALGFAHASFAGVLLSLGWSGSPGRWLLPGNSAWLRLPVVVRGVAGVSAAVLLVATLAGPVLGPFRADRAHHEAMMAMTRSDGEVIESKLLEAVRHQPYDGILWNLLGEVQASAGDHDLAHRSLTRAAELRPGDPAMAVRAARSAVGLLVRPGYLAEAIRWYEVAAASDPYGSSRAEAADFFSAIGKQDRALELQRDGSRDGR